LEIIGVADFPFVDMIFSFRVPNASFGFRQTRDAGIEKVSIIVSRGSLEGVYPALIMTNGARMEGIEATLFFTFFGLDAVINKRMDNLKVATVGNPAMHLPTVVGAIPGMSAFATRKMQKEMETLDIPPVREFIEMIHDAGGELYACKASVRYVSPDEG
jgi:peroxiredoxin family protein